MSNRWHKTASLVLGAVLLPAACARHVGKDVDALARGSEVEAVAIPSDYANSAIDATGGLDAWTKTKELHFECVVTFYQSDGSFYLTEQRYDVCPLSNSITISGVEP